MRALFPGDLLPERCDLFRRGARRTALDPLRAEAVAGWRLYIGHSERITGAAAKLFEAEGATIYRLRQGEVRHETGPRAHR